MASYESPSAIMAAVSGFGFSAATVAAIGALVNDMGGAAVQNTIPISEDLYNENLASLVGNGQFIMMEGATKADVTFPATSQVGGIIVGSGGNSNVTFQGNNDVVVALQGGQNDAVTTAGGNDIVSMMGNSATISTGGGSDTVVIGKSANGIEDTMASVNTGEGNDLVLIDNAATGRATILAGDGFDQVQVGGKAGEHHFAFQNGVFTMESSVVLNMDDGVNVVTFSDSPDVGAKLTSATVLAHSAAESLVGKLYQVALDRDNGGLDSESGSAATANANQLAGLEFWLDQFQASSVVLDGASDLAKTVYSFLNCDEFHSKYDGMDNQAYVEALFANMGLAADDQVNGKTVTDYVNSISSNAIQDIGRYNVAWSLAASDETVKLIGNGAENGAQYVIDGGEFDLEDPLA